MNQTRLQIDSFIRPLLTREIWELGREVVLPPPPYSTAKPSPLSCGRLRGCKSVSGIKPETHYIAQAALKLEQSSCLSLPSIRIDLLLFII